MMRKLHFLLMVLILGAAGPLAAETLPGSREEITLTFAPLVKQVTPAVVNIYTKKLVNQRLSPLLADPLFRQFFGADLPEGFARRRLENSLGSGVIVRSDGLIVTSNHVIDGATEIRVVLSDRREFDATLVTSDGHSDLAVLRVNTNGEKLPFLTLKDSDEAQIGDLVLAIGNPYGVGQTVTSGIISAMAHTTVGSSDLHYFIQTDAAINPGNSGGALVTMDGKLVGINAAIYSQSGGSLGIGFAVPSNMVRVVLKAVDEGKRSLTRAWLGFEGQQVTPEIAASLSMPQPRGVLVKSVRPKGPAQEGGLQQGDVIVALNGKPIDDLASFYYRIATLPLGSEATFAVLHKGQKVDLRILLKSPPEDPPRDKVTFTGNNPFGGTTVENLSPAVIDELGLRGSEEGVVIATVDPMSIAARVGFTVGDIVRVLNDNKIYSVQDLKLLLVDHKDTYTRYQITLQRGDNMMTIMVSR